MCTDMNRSNMQCCFMVCLSRRGLSLPPRHALEEMWATNPHSIRAVALLVYWNLIQQPVFVTPSLSCNRVIQVYTQNLTGTVPSTISAITALSYVGHAVGR